jgi:uncharacterized protein YqgC (DUF456 family)
MEWILLLIGFLLVVAGIAGSFLPLLPGPPIAFIGLLIQQWRDPNPYSAGFLLFWAGMVLLTLVLDYLVPIWGTKKFGGSKYGIWGCTIGFLAAFWMGPWGVILGPFAGAFIGELLAKQNSKNALLAAWGSFVGFLLGSFLKIIVCFFMLYYLIKAIPSL